MITNEVREGTSTPVTGVPTHKVYWSEFWFISSPNLFVKPLLFHCGVTGWRLEGHLAISWAILYKLGPLGEPCFKYNCPDGWIGGCFLSVEPHP